MLHIQNYVTNFREMVCIGFEWRYMVWENEIYFNVYKCFVIY
jgi:hypothetical protein